ncbi:MAG: hypothetical protein PVF58_06920 [Candidatus Methanofastidiosia archaeon]|jgi:hypothetical protein
MDAVIENLDKLDFIETFFRLRVYDLKKEKRNEFLNFLKKSKLPMIRTIIKIKLLNPNTIKIWNSEIEKSEFEKAITIFPYTFIIPALFLDLIYKVKNFFIELILKIIEIKNELIPFFILILFIILILSIIFILNQEFGTITQISLIITLIGTISSIIGTLLNFWRRTTTIQN